MMQSQSWNRLTSLVTELVETQRTIEAIDVSLITPHQQLHFGAQQSHLPETPLFLVASLTKPFVALATMHLIEQGMLTLNQKVSTVLPEFKRHSKQTITVRQLLSHTSGLPDQPADDQQLREAESPLTLYWQRACETELDNPPGTRARYSSLGYVVLAKLIETLSGQSLPNRLETEFFHPLGMASTWLGLPQDSLLNSRLEQSVPVQQVAAYPDLSKRWNTPYWRTLGAPWGGMTSTSADLIRFAQWMLSGTPQLSISQASKNLCTEDQLQHQEKVDSFDKTFRCWGLGFRQNWPGHSTTFGDYLSPQAYGHWGATGALLWIDPVLQAACVICTSQATVDSELSLQKLSNLAALTASQSN